MRQILIGPLLLLLTGYGYAWNAVGHQLIAQIAYDNLNPAAKRLCNQYLHAYTKKAAPYDFIISSTWLDMLKRKRIHRYDALHYIDIPFSQDGTKLPAIAKPNALSKMQQAIKVLSSKKTSYYSKGLNLRILIHIVGDIHQPLHTTTQVSKRFPHGDLGGNLFILSANPNGKNLHKYWDNGAGFLKYDRKNIKLNKWAHFLEKKGSCERANLSIKPQEWINESHQIALTHVYTLVPYQSPSKIYTMNAQSLVEQQVFYAGCRLASLLNRII